jgi:outer membrane protein insertion porin family
VGSLDWAATRWLSAALQYEVERNRVSDEEELGELAANTGLASGPERLRFPTGLFTLQTARVTLSADFRDEPITPRRGLLLSGTAEATRDLRVQPDDEAPFPVRFVKVQGAATGYVPLAGRAVLALSARGGTILPLEEQARTIAPKRFYLGGPGTLRGFGEDRLLPEDVREDLRAEVAPCRGFVAPSGCSSRARRLLDGTQLLSEGGELFALAKAELRLPVAGALDLGLFAEAGNLWLDRAEASLRNLRLRPVAGAGLRYVTPVGPLALDVGFNLDRDRVVNESAAQVHFSIGLF